MPTYDFADAERDDLHVTVDGALGPHRPLPYPGAHRTRRPAERRVDLWWSGKHAAHGGDVQVIAAPDGWPLWTSGVRPGREHDTTALRVDPEALPLLAEWTDEDHVALADLRYEGERAALTMPIKKITNAPLTDDQRTVNLLHAATRAPAERGNSLLKPPSKRCAGSAFAPGASAPSLPPPSCCSTTSTAAPHDNTTTEPSLGKGH